MPALWRGARARPEAVRVPRPHPFPCSRALRCRLRRPSRARGPALQVRRLAPARRPSGSFAGGAAGRRGPGCRMGGASTAPRAPPSAAGVQPGRAPGSRAEQAPAARQTARPARQDPCHAPTGGPRPALEARQRARRVRVAGRGPGGAIDPAHRRCGHDWGHAGRLRVSFAGFWIRPCDRCLGGESRRIGGTERWPSRL